jgi:transcriptional regulator with XRE-family HTH domain
VVNGPFKRFGVALRALRLEAGLSQEDVGVACGVTQKTISQWEQGSSDGAFEHLYELEKACKVPAGMLLRRSGLAGDPADVRDQIRLDTALDETTRPVVLGAYDSAVKATDRARRPRTRRR